MANLVKKVNKKAFGKIKKIWDKWSNGDSDDSYDQAHAKITKILMEDCEYHRPCAESFAWWILVVAREIEWEDPDIEEGDPPKRKWWLVGDDVYVKNGGRVNA